MWSQVWKCPSETGRFGPWHTTEPSDSPRIPQLPIIQQERIGIPWESLLYIIGIDRLSLCKVQCRQLWLLWNHVFNSCAMCWREHVSISSCFYILFNLPSIGWRSSLRFRWGCIKVLFRPYLLSSCEFLHWVHRETSLIKDSSSICLLVWTI